MSIYPLPERQYTIRQGDDIMYIDAYTMTSFCTHVGFLEVTLKAKFSDTYSHYYAPTSADIVLPERFIWSLFAMHC